MPDVLFPIAGRLPPQDVVEASVQFHSPPLTVRRLRRMVTAILRANRLHPYYRLRHFRRESHDNPQKTTCRPLIALYPAQPYAGDR